MSNCNTALPWLQLCRRCAYINRDHTYTLLHLVLSRPSWSLVVLGPQKFLIDGHRAVHAQLQHSPEGAVRTSRNQKPSKEIIFHIPQNTCSAAPMPPPLLDDDDYPSTLTSCEHPHITPAIPPSIRPKPKPPSKQTLQLPPERHISTPHGFSQDSRHTRVHIKICLRLKPSAHAYTIP